MEVVREVAAMSVASRVDMEEDRATTTTDEKWTGVSVF